MPDGLTLAALEAAPHGIDLGPLEPRLPEALRTASGLVELTPERVVADLPRLEEALALGAAAAGEERPMVLVGRRDLRSNNSWMHNLPLLAGGPGRCTALLHPDDAARLGLRDGEPVRVRSRVGEIELPAQVDDGIMPGVVSIPHGWGHGVAGVGWRRAAADGGANANLLADEQLVDPLSGNAVLNGIPVTLAPVAAPAPA